MLACNHDRSPFGSPLCIHLRTCREPWLRYVKWYVGTALNTEFLCVPCAERREQGVQVEVANVCAECFEYATTEVCNLVRVGGKAEIQIRSEPISDKFKETSLPAKLGTIVDIAPVNHSRRSIWLLLAEDGKIFRVDADAEEFTEVGRSTVPAEPDHKPWNGHALTKRLHASNNGEFVAVVNDYGHYGQIIDLRSREVTVSLHTDEYHPETVPFSFAFADFGKTVIAIYRTEWNRLDFSNPATGKLLSARAPTRYRDGEARPEHYLDYFHGALYVDSTSMRILDDGWIWHPIGVPATWRLDRWFSENVWESEDGSTKTDVCGREYYWDHAVAWLDSSRVIIGGIGDDADEIIDGARIFDVTKSVDTGRLMQEALELMTFAGPAGKFFCDGVSLFSSSESGLSRWSVEDGARTGYVQDFQPSQHHRGARELVQLKDRVLTRWSFQ